MTSKANKWGWKALAARMLLAPVLMAGPFAVPALAQTAPKAPAPGTARTATAPTKADPKELLKQGRKALSEGRFDAAQDLARQADANNPQGRWGLLGDTPESLVKDCQAARAKADKAEADQLVKEAKDLFARPAKTEADRAANLDAAAAKIDRACSLAGPAGFIDEINVFAERPEALKREIDSARGKLRRTVPPANDARATYAGSTKSPATTGLPKPNIDTIALPKALEVTPVEATRPVSTTNGRPAAEKLMAEGRTLLAGDYILEAKVKFGEANKLNVPFAYNEENPDRCLQDAAAKGKEKIESLVRMGQEFASRKDVVKAEASFNAALKLAAGLDMRTRAIETELAALKGGKTVAVSAQLPDAPPLNIEPIPEKIEVPGLPMIGEPKLELPKIETPKVEAPKADLPKIDAPKLETPKLETPKPVDLDVPPVGLPELPVLPGTDAKKPVDPKPEAKPMIGRKLLDEAAAELKSGQVEMARKLAIQANNTDATVKVEAQQLLREIDAEMHTAKKKEAVASFKAASEAFNAKQYASAESLLQLIDATLLSAEQAKSHEAMLRMSAAAVAKAKEPMPGAAPTAPPMPGALIQSTPTNPAAPGANLADQMKALTDVEFQQLRSEGLQAESQALESFKKGETDVAITTLTDYVNKVKASKLSTARQNLLTSAAERRLDTFRIMKKQMDFYTKEAKEKKDQRERIVMKSAAEQQKQDEISKRVQQVNALLKSQKYREAEALALQTKQLDPENPTIALIYELAKNNRRVNDAKTYKAENEEFNLQAFNNAEKQGQYVDVENPIALKLKTSRNNLNRGPGDELFIKTRTPIEREIELKLEKPLTLEFQQATLREVIRKFADTAIMNIVTDDAALADLSIDLDKVLVTESIKQPISLRNVMQLILEKSGLQYVVEHDVVRVTSVKKAKGRMYTKVFSVMDLVTPIPDFALPEHASLSKALERQQNPTMPWMTDTKNASTLSNPKGGLNDGRLVSGDGPWKNEAGFGKPNGVLDNNQPGGTQVSPLSAGAFLAPNKANHSEQLKKLITGMVRAYSWEDLGGPGKIAYYDIGGALVVNQTADVIKEVQDLLESLRRLQDLSVAVEIRIISLTEAFYERIGVDFQMNIKTHNSTSFEQGLTTGAFRPEPFINSNNGKGVTGWNPAAGGYTSDLNVPIRPNTYGYSVPPFGGYPGNGNGGLNLGLAFLNDIQVFMFLEASAGDRRVNVMQAPKITLFNGQTSTVSVSDLAYFTLGLQIINVGGQFVYIPQSTPLPIGQGAGLGGGQGVSVTVQAVVSADRRYVRMNLAPQLSALASATVPLFPVTAFITPVFEGGSQGQPIPFTQFFQQPSFTSITVQTTVAVPDGGTVLLGGLKTLEEGRNEVGPPVVSQIPYLNRLFRNTGIGRETRHIMIMVTPRIIITAEEEQIQTQEGGLSAGR